MPIPGLEASLPLPANHKVSRIDGVSCLPTGGSSNAGSLQLQGHNWLKDQSGQSWKEEKTVKEHFDLTLSKSPQSQSLQQEATHSLTAKETAAIDSIDINTPAYSLALEAFCFAFHSNVGINHQQDSSKFPESLIKQMMRKICQSYQTVKPHFFN